MNVLGYGLLAFLFAFLIHFIIWKVRVPKKNQTVVLLEIFFGVLVLSVFLKGTSSFYDFLAYIFLYISLTFAYITTYSAIEVDSPSVTMILTIAKESTKDSNVGLDREAFYSRMNNEVLIVPRIKDLVKDKMIFFEKDKYRLTAKGLFLVNIFIWWRKLMNAPKGG